MGQNQSGFMPDGQQGDKKKKPEKKKWQPPAPPTRVGKKLKKKGMDGLNRLPNVTPASKCLLRKLKLERIKDWLLMEEEFVGNQERIKPHTERAEEEKSKVDDLRGAPMSVGNLEEIIDDKYVKTPVSPELRARSFPVTTDRRDRSRLGVQDRWSELARI
jgi:26S proteasome regulatory subunit T2